MQRFRSTALLFALTIIAAPRTPAQVSPLQSQGLASSLASGTIVDGADVVAGARVDLVVADGDTAPLLRRAYTAADGRYTLVDAPAGTYRLVVATAVEGGWEEQSSVEVSITAEGRPELVAIDLASP